MSVVILSYRRGWGICLVVGFVRVLVCSVDGKDGFLYSLCLGLQCVVLVDRKQQSAVVRRKEREVLGDQFRIFVMSRGNATTLPS